MISELFNKKILHLVLVFSIIFSLSVSTAFAASSIQSTYISSGSDSISKAGGSSMSVITFGDVAGRITNTNFIMEVGFAPTTLVTTSLTEETTTTTTSSGSSRSESAAPSVASFAAISIVESLTEIIQDPLEFRTQIILAQTEPLVLDLNIATGVKPIKKLAIYINEKQEIGNPAKGGSYIIYDRYGDFERNLCLHGDNPFHHRESNVYYCNKAGLFDNVQFELTESLKQFNGKTSIYFTKTFEDYNIDIYAYDDNNKPIYRQGLPIISLTVLEPKDFIEFVGWEIPEEQNIDPEIIFIKEKRSPVPEWVKERSKAWASDSSSDVGFAQGLQEMISREILHLPQDKFEVLDEESQSIQIPDWVKNNAQWFAEDEISEDEFVDAIQYLIYNEHIKL